MGHLESSAAPVASKGGYSRLEELIAAQRCVVLDGAIGTELIDVGGSRPEADEHLWGIGEIVDSPEAVRAVHRRYAEGGCDVLSTNTWGLASALRQGRVHAGRDARPVHWMDVARRGVTLAREAVHEAGRGGEPAVAFSLNGDVDTEDGAETIRLLARAFEDGAPDLILLETLSLVRSSTFETIESLMATGLPVWVSFRRCRHGVCGVYGEHWGGPEGDAFGRAARRFEEMGVGALLVNCTPPDHVPGMISWLRDFTDLPLGAYPNLGYLSSAGWRHAHEIDGDRYAEMALDWRREGAQIIGGCCGVGPDHLAAAAVALADTEPGNWRPGGRGPGAGPVQVPPRSGRWEDERGRPTFPIDFPDLVVEPNVAGPTQASFLIWKHLSREGVGAHQRCLDVGAGTGLLAVQLARNGATHVHAIDRDQAAATNTMTNAFRNRVAERVTAAAVDLYPWVPDERYDVVVACLDQEPVDPLDQLASHRPVDYWGRSLLDHLIGLLPESLADDGVAYIVHHSVIGERRTVEQLDALGFDSRVVDFAFLEFPDGHPAGTDHLARIEELSDAYHLALGDAQVTVAYLIEVTRGQGSA